MPKAAIRASDDATHVSRRQDAVTQKKRRTQAKQKGQTSFLGKKFSELNQPAKDALLEAIALQLGFIEPED